MASIIFSIFFLLFGDGIKCVHSTRCRALLVEEEKCFPPITNNFNFFGFVKL